MLDVLVIGAGFAGICAAIKLKEAGLTRFKVAEKAQAIGGTWQSNIYPGAACDVPSHFYCYSFFPNPNWSRKFAPQKEILSYIESAVEHFGVGEYIQLGTKVRALHFDEIAGTWTAEIDGGERLRARYVINGMGGLHRPSVPNFKGKGSFKGQSMHSAQWDERVDFAGKTVAVIGSAASAIQIIPELQKTAGQVDIYQRTPNYIAPRYDRAFTAEEKARFARWPWLARFYRWLIYKRLELLVYPLTKQNSPFSAKASKGIKDWINTAVKDEALRARLIPDYRIGCKRILLSDKFYETLNKGNVRVITDPIRAITPDGIETDGQAGAGSPTLNRADVIVYATGFDLEGHMRSIKVTGRGGVTLEGLGDAAEAAFKGTAHPDFPNYYLITGPNTGVGTSSVVYMIELQLGYILKLLAAGGRGKLLRLRGEVMRAYNARIQDELSRSVWVSGCKSWYQREDGKIVTLYPGNAKQFAKEHARLDLKNYEVTVL